MKFERTPKFKKDWKDLPEEHKAIFRSLMPAFNAACDAYAANPATVWPANLRVSQMTNRPGIWEMTWSFAGPDGRATFEFFTEQEALWCRWRRVGTHTIYKNP